MYGREARKAEAKEAGADAEPARAKGEERGSPGKEQSSRRRRRSSSRRSRSRRRRSASRSQDRKRRSRSPGRRAGAERRGGDAEGTGRVFVGGLPSGTSEDALERLFGKYGKVLDVKVITSQYRREQASALVRMEDAASARAAVLALHDRHEFRPGQGAIKVRHSNTS